MEIAVNLIQTKLCASSSNLADMLIMVNPIDFGGHSSKVKVTMGIIDKCGVRGDATLCIVTYCGASIAERHLGITLYLKWFQAHNLGRLNWLPQEVFCTVRTAPF